MATEIKSVQELLDIYTDEVRARSNDKLTDFTEGSIGDIEGGASMTGVHEAMSLIVDRFKKTFLDSADGPEITLGPDDLQTLATDHFGDTFKRPLAQPAKGIVTFSRPTSGAGTVNILAGTIVKTSPDAGGQSQRFRTIAAVTLAGLTINASVEAIVPGINGNVASGTCNQIETTLTDPTIVVSNSLGFSGGAAIMNDQDYREYIRNLIEAIKGATIAAIEAKAKTVSGVVTATIVEIEQVVKEWIIASSTTTGDYFRIPRPTLYISDANGTANQALIDSVKAAIEFVRACGVYIKVIGATALPVNWTGAYTLNLSGPNYTELSADSTKIIDTMKDYLRGLPVGTGFIIADANAYIMSIWGPSGTNDISSFSTVIPAGNIGGSTGVKIIPGTVIIGTC